MATFDPSDPVVTKVEIYAGPTLGWVDVTSRGRAASCVISQGMSANAIQPETSRLDITLGNPDGYLTEDNAMSPWYGYWGRGCEIRVSRIGLTVSPAERFHGKVQSIEESYPGGNVDATVRVTAVGTLGILGLGSDPLRSPLYRAMVGISEGDFQPVAHWSCEDGSDATQISPSIPGTNPGVVHGDISLASSSAVVGSRPLPVLTSGDLIFDPPLFTATGVWQVQFTMLIPSLLASDTVLAYLYPGPGDAVAEIRIVWKSGTAGVELDTFDASGGSLGTSGAPGSPTPGTPVMVGVTSGFIGSRFIQLGMFRLDTGGLIAAVSVNPGGTTTNIRRVKAHANSVSAGWSFGQLAIYSDPNVITVPNIGPNAQAAGGYVGETAADRMDRLCREEGVSFELTGAAADTVPMGPQLTDTLFNNLRDCATTDQGLMHDNGTDGAVGYVTRTQLYNQTATIAVTEGAIEPNLKALRDYQYVRNDVTSTRSGGASAHVPDEAHVTKIGARLKDTRTPNVEADDQLPHDAGWAVHIGTAPGARYNSVGINLRNPYGALLADAVAGHAIGDRLTVAKTALPPQHHIDGIDGLTVGWTEVLDADTWIFRPNVVPYGPYQVGVYNDTVKRYGSNYTYAAEDLDTTETAIDVEIREAKKLWITGSTGPVFPLDAGIDGEKIRVSAIASVISDAFGRTTSPGWGSPDAGPSSYTNAGGSATDHTVSGGTGRMSVSAKNTTFSALITASFATWDVYGTVTFPATPTGASAEEGCQVRRVDGSNFVDCRIFLLTGGTAQIIVRQVLAGVETIGAFTTIPGVTATSAIRWRLQAAGSTLRAKAWLASGTEPSYWLDSITTTMLSAGSLLLYTTVPNTLTNALPLLVQWDNLAVVNPQQFTVARSQNGVVKSHSSGAQVKLWTPAVYGY